MTTPYLVYRAGLVPKCDPPLIAFCNIYSGIYGAQRSLLQLYTERYRQRRYRLRFIYTVAGALSDAVAALGIPMTRLGLGPLLGSFNKRLLGLRLENYVPLAGEGLAHARAISRVLVQQQASLMHCNTHRDGLMSDPSTPQAAFASVICLTMSMGTVRAAWGTSRVSSTPSPDRSHCTVGRPTPIARV